MKTLLPLLILFSFSCFAQENTKPDTIKIEKNNNNYVITKSTNYNATSIQIIDTTICQFPDKIPQFIGGEKEMNNFIKCNISFIVEKDGTLSNIKALYGNPILINEALRVVSIMPKWTPGQFKGKMVKVMCNLPINFKL